MNGISILHEASEKEPFLIVLKERGLPSAPLKAGDLSAFTLASEKYPQILSISSRKAVEGGLVHRIDTETRGLILIACSQEFYDHMIFEQNQGRFKKRYSAECQKMDVSSYLEGFPECSLGSNVHEGMEFIVSSKFRSFGEKGREVRPVVENGGKYALKKASPETYTTRITLNSHGDFFHAKCFLTKGYRHQVRCHLAWTGFPIVGDPVYFPHSNDTNSNQEFSFTADGLYFSWKEKNFQFEI